MRDGVLEEVPPTLRPIQHRYLLVLAIPIYRDAGGRLWTDPLWQRDLIEHLNYLDHFTLACPCFVGKPPPTVVPVDDPRLHVLELPSRHKASLRLPITLFKLWRGIGAAEVVHTGLGGWLPVSLGNLTALITVLRGRYLLVNVESSPWRLVPGQPASWLQRCQAGLAEWVNRECLRHVDLAILTQSGYRDSLMPPERHDRAHIVHATWIDAVDIVTDDQAHAAWSAKRRSWNDGRLRLLFAGRLTAAKGVGVLLEALQQLDESACVLELHMIGHGDMHAVCAEAARHLRHVQLRLLEPVAYGPDFFQLVRGYDAVVVPSLSEEQPRIVYDAFSQAVPVLASNTGGLRDCVDDGVTGWLCKANDANSLRRLLQRATGNLDQLEELGMAALQLARSMTHVAMHRQRWALLEARLPPRQP